MRFFSVLKFEQYGQSYAPAPDVKNLKISADLMFVKILGTELDVVDVGTAFINPSPYSTSLRFFAPVPTIRL